MKRFLKVLLWIVGAAGLVLLVLFAGAMFERQAELAKMSDEDKAELRQKLVDGELGTDEPVEDAGAESGARSAVVDILARIKSPTVLRYGGISLGAVLLVWLAVGLVRFRRTLAERRRKKAAGDQLDQALDKIEQDIEAGPGGKRRKGAEPESAAPAKPPFWARWTKKKKPAVSTADADIMPWETAEEDEAPTSGGEVAAVAPTPSMELESYSARGKPSKTIDRPAEKLLGSGAATVLDDGGRGARPFTPDSQPAAEDPYFPSENSIQAVGSSGGGFRPRDLEAAQRLLSKHMTRSIGQIGASLSIDRTAQLVAVAEAAVRSRPELDQSRRAHLPIEVRLAIRLAEEIGRQGRPGEDKDLAQVMVDVVLGLQEEG